MPARRSITAVIPAKDGMLAFFVGYMRWTTGVGTRFAVALSDAAQGAKWPELARPLIEELIWIGPENPRIQAVYKKSLSTSNRASRPFGAISAVGSCHVTNLTNCWSNYYI